MRAPRRSTDTTFTLRNKINTSDRCLPYGKRGAGVRNKADNRNEVLKKSTLPEEGDEDEDGAK